MSYVATFARPNYLNVKSQVAAIREELSIYEPPVNPVEVANSLGVGVRFVEFGPEHGKISGFYDPEDHAIYVNKHEYPLRQTFTIAHELGHALLHRDWASSDDYRVLMRDDNTDYGEPHEKEANAFAAQLLVPRDMLDRYAHLSAENLSKLFAVSVPMIKNRLSFEYGIRA